jgi:hypothetical protein
MINKSTLAKKLASYSTLASVVLLAGEKAEGQIRYSAYSPPDTIPIGYYQPLDLNQDGTIDMSFSEWIYMTRYNYEIIASASLYGDVEMQLNPTSIGKVVNSSGDWKTSSNVGRILSSTGGYNGPYGKWHNVFKKFMPLKLTVGGKTYYGWIRLSIGDKKIIIYDYAYQQIPNTPIITGDTGFFKSPPIIKMADSVYCGEDSFAIQAINIPEGAILQWYRNDSLFETPTADTTIILKQSGNYYAVVSLDSNSTVTNLISVEIPFLPEKPSIKQNQDSLISSEAFSYQWYANSRPIIGFTTREILPEESGYYQVMITDSNGCSNISDSLQVVITGIKNNIPSPKLFASNNVLHVQMLNANFINGSLSIFNDLGQSVLNQTISSENFTINLTEFPAEIYIVRLEKNGQQIVRKILIQ